MGTALVVAAEHTRHVVFQEHLEILDLRQKLLGDLKLGHYFLISPISLAMTPSTVSLSLMAV